MFESAQSAKRCLVLLAFLSLTGICLALPLTAFGQEQESDPASAETDATELSAEELAIKQEEEARLAVRRTELARDLEARQTAIRDLQSEQGIYYPGLIEAYSDIANVHAQLEDYESATAALTDALQIARINTGLYSEQQLPLLDELIVQTARMQEWEDVDDLVHLDHHISSRVYDLDDSEYLAAAEDYGEWKLRVLRENLLQLSSQGLMNTAEDLSEFYGSLIFRVELADHVEADDLLKLLLGKSQADLSLARAIANTPYTYFQGTASPYVNRTRCRNVRGPNGTVSRQCFNVQVENPRYRQSQRDAKRFTLNRYSREIVKIIERMQVIRDSSNSLSLEQRQQLDSQIAQLEAEAAAVRRVGSRSFAF